MSTSKALTLCLLALLILSGCAGMAESRESPRVTLVGIKMINAEIFEQRYGLMLRIQNPNPNALVITGMSFKVEINEKSFASGVSDTNITVEGFGEAKLDVEVVSSLFDIVEQLRGLEKRQGQPLVYRIHGKIQHAGSPFSIPFERKGRIGGPATGSEPDGTIHAT
ncbi:MAG: LEA type 2 family protein [Candidatus Sedimenticola sp. 4PFRAG1]